MHSADEQTYWIMPLKVVDPRYGDADQYRALFTYIILFAGSIVFSDSAVVGNRLFRLALRADVEGSGDGFTRELVDHGYLRFAIREREGVALTLADTANDILTRAGEHWVGYEPVSDMPEFRYVQDHGHLLRYSLDGAAERFRHEVLRVFSSSPFEKGGLPKTYQRVFVSLIEEMLAKGDPLGLADFSEGSALWERVMKRTGKPYLFERYGDFVYAVARGPHATFLPEQLGVNPTYSPSDKLAIDRWRGRDQDEAADVAMHTIRTQALGLADFASGLCRLTGLDVHALRTSDERRAYDRVLREFALRKARSAEVLRALVAYRRRVEDRIMSRLQARPVQNIEFKGQVSAYRSFGTEIVRWVVVDGVAMLADVATGSLYSRVRYVWDRVHELQNEERATIRTAVERENLRREFEAVEAEKDEIVEDLVRTASPTVEASVIVDKPGVRDFSAVVRP